MQSPEFIRAESGLLVPATVNRSAFSNEPMNSCDEMHEILAGLRESIETEDDPDVVGPMTSWHNDLVEGCDQHCYRLNEACGVSEVAANIRNSRAAIEVVREEPVALFLERLELAVSFLFEINDGIPRLSPHGKQMKRIIEQRLVMATQEGSAPKDHFPEVTDGAYEELIARSGASVSPGPNYRVGILVFSKLFEASVDQSQNPDDEQVPSRHMVVPQEPGLIQRADVAAIYDSPDEGFQYWLRIANEPRGQFQKTAV